MNDKNISELDKQMRLQKKQNELGIVGIQLELNREKEHLPGPKTCCGEEWPQTCSSDERRMANTGRTGGKQEKPRALMPAFLGGSYDVGWQSSSKFTRKGLTLA